MKSNIGNIKIKGLVGAIPKNISFFDDEINNYSHDKNSSKKLKKMMGYDQHRVVDSNLCVSDFAKEIFQHCMNKKLFNSEKIDAIILVTQTPDYIIPPTSAILHGNFDLNENCYCVDINDGCNGYVKGLFQAASLVRSSDAKKILLISGDVLSRKVSKKDRNSYPLIGDALTFTLIEENDKEDCYYPLEILYNGAQYESLIIPAGGMKTPTNDKTSKEKIDSEGNIRSLDNLVMNGRDVFSFTQTTVASFIDYFLKKHSQFDIDYYFLHQANEFIIDRIRKKFNLNKDILPSEVISKFGNSSSATIPMSLINKFYKTSINELDFNVFLAGFGVGLSWGAAITKVNQIDFCDLIEI